MKKVLSILSCLLHLFIVEAQASTPPPLLGWTHIGSFSGDSSQRHGVFSPGGPIIYSSSVIAELDGETSNGKEVVVASADGTVAAYLASGVLLWTARTPNYGCGPSNDRIYSSPAVGALNGGNSYYVVIGYGGFTRNNCDGGVVAFRGTDGSQAWKLSLVDFGRTNRFGANLHSVYSTPGLADVDHDGRLEVGFGSLDRNVYLLESSGRVRWYYNAADTVFSSPTFANVDRSRNLEMIIGTDISRNDNLRPPTKDGGFLYAFKTNKLRSSNKRIRFNNRGAFVWKRYFNQVIQSSPIIADVSSRRGKEIVVGSGCFFPQNRTAKNGNWIRILRLSDGATIRTLNAPGCMTSSPAVGDLDGDGRLNVVATVNGDASSATNDDSHVVAWNADHSNPIWATVPRPLGRNDASGGTLQSPVVADLDGNGSLEVIVTNSSGISILSGRDGNPLTCQGSICASDEVVLQTGGVLKSTPAIGDINGDRIHELVVGGTGGSQGVIYAWTNFQQILRSSPGLSSAYSAPTEMFRGNPARTGEF